MELKMTKNFKSLVGQKFGKLTVESIDEAQYLNGKKIKYNCKCECGETRNGVERQRLVNGKVTGCKKCSPYRFRGASVKEVDRELAIYRTLFRALKQTKNKNPARIVTLTFQEFVRMISQNCFYCNRPPYQIAKDTARVARKPGRLVSNTQVIHCGLDRTDNNECYSIANCVPCCSECNYCKGKMDQDKFLELVKMIHYNFYERSEPIEGNLNFKRVSNERFRE